MSKKVNIYYSGFLSRVGGAYYHAVNLSKGLKEQGYEVKILTFDDLPLILRYIPHLLQFAINKICFPLGYIYKDSVIKNYTKLVYKNSADIHIFENIYSYWPSEKKSIVLLHALWSDNLQAFRLSEQKRRLLEKKEAKIINNIKTNIITVSRPYKDFISSRLTPYILANKINIVELGIDISGFNPIKNNINKSIVYSGALEARKNLIFLLDVYYLLKEYGDYSLTIIGDGPQKKELMDIIAHKKIKNITFLGRLNYSEVIKELETHEYYLHTSTKESFSYSLLEAKLSGLTTIAYSKLEVPSSFIDIKVEEFDIQKWVDGIVEYDEPKNNNEFEKNKFSYQVMTKNTLDHLK